MAKALSSQLHQPLRFIPDHVERVWGGRRLADLFGRRLPDVPVGESWEIHGALKVSEGPLRGRTLDELVGEYGSELLGALGEGSKSFPLLTKWLDCKDWLSVQVHPDDRLAAELTGDPAMRGKTEAWYVVHADPEARLIHGLQPGSDVDAVERAEDDNVLEHFRQAQPQAGELLFTSAGTVHALGPGYVIYEIQQSSDLTYRLYDWGRDRPIHPAESYRCMREVVECEYEMSNGGLSCPFFTIEQLTSGTVLRPGGETFLIVAAVDGRWQVGDIVLEAGDTALLPACLRAVEVAPLEGGTLLSVGLGR